MLKIGHRGAPSVTPENTLLSFKQALEAGADAVELDVHLCKSGEIVVIHDETVDRTTNGKGAVKDRSLKELKLLDAGKGEKIPTLAEVCDLINGRARIFIEIKNANASEAVADFIESQVQEHGYQDSDLIVISFDKKVLERVRRRNPFAKIGFTFDDGDTEKIRKAISELNPDTINPSINILTEEIMELAHQEGVEVMVWTANSPEEIQKAKDLGVDGIMSDFPDRL